MSAEKKLEVITLPSGVSTKALGRRAYDWPSIRVLAEKGVPYATIAKEFNGLDPRRIAMEAHRKNWLTPQRERKMQKEVMNHQRRRLEAGGEVREVDAVIKDIWEERSARTNEKIFSIVEDAIDGVDPDLARTLIAEAKDLKTVLDIARRVTGQEARERREENDGPKLAVNMHFLRSARPIPVETGPTIDV